MESDGASVLNRSARMRRPIFIVQQCCRPRAKKRHRRSNLSKLDFVPRKFEVYRSLPEQLFLLKQERPIDLQLFEGLGRFHIN